MGATERKRSTSFSWYQTSLSPMPTISPAKGSMSTIAFCQSRSSRLIVTVVRGMIVQVLENLISNSLYWLRQQERLEPEFQPKLTLVVNTASYELRFSDNGPGISVSDKDKVFEAFYTKRPAGEGKGLGLFISREIAKYHGAGLRLEPGDDDVLRAFIHRFGRGALTAGTLDAGEEAPKLEGYLRNRAVKGVLFIDDGFDPLEQVEPTNEEREELWTAIEADLLAQAAAVEKKITGPHDLTGHNVAAILSRAVGDPLRSVAEAASYVVDYRSKTKELQYAIDYLESLGVTVRTAGGETWRDKLDGVSIVFLDWKLGSEANREAAVAQACKTAKEIHEQREKPLIVLISSDPAVETEAKTFSAQSGLIPGLFDAMPKKWLNDRRGVDLQMMIIGEHLQKGHLVQTFVDAVRQRASDAIQAFTGALQGLTLSDYANLQHFALRHEGHPLGDYLTELLAGVWVDALFQGTLRDHLKALDSEDFESLPALMEPSEALVQLYNSAVFDKHVGDFTEHPHRVASPQVKAPTAPDATAAPGGEDAAPQARSEATERPKRLSLSLGDLVLEFDGANPRRAYVIMNPQCDLAESPRHKREIADDLSILLAPGLLRPISAPERTERKESADTPFFADGEARHRIQWEGKKLLAVPYCEFADWMAEKQRQRKARMRPAYALALQQSITSELTRVGLPIPPPMYERSSKSSSRTFGQLARSSTRSRATRPSSDGARRQGRSGGSHSRLSRADFGNTQRRAYDNEEIGQRQGY